LIDGLAQLEGRYRGMAVAEPNINLAELERRHRAGVRAVRVNLVFKGGISYSDRNRRRKS
jgi:hypothetical protein